MSLSFPRARVASFPNTTNEMMTLGPSALHHVWWMTFWGIVWLFYWSFGPILWTRLFRGQTDSNVTSGKLEIREAYQGW